MCARVTIIHSMQDIAGYFNADLFGDSDALNRLTPRYNVSPTNDLVTVTGNGSRTIRGMYWGLVPSWAREKSIGARMINARSETLTQKPAFRGLLRRNRCIIAADGFYEWVAEGKARRPLHIELTGKPIFGMAGLWDTWRQPDGGKLESCTLITVPANAMMSAVHDRMPAILAKEDYDLWLDGSLSDPGAALAALKPYDDRQMRAYPVSPMVNKPGVEDPAFIEPWGERQDRLPD